MKGRLLAATIAASSLLGLVAPSPAEAFDFRPGAEGFNAAVYDEGNQPETLAGAHPVALTLTAGFTPSAKGGAPFTEGDLRNLEIEMPPGLIENPTAVDLCTQDAFHTPRSSPFEASLSGESCQDRSQVGIITLRSSYGGEETRTFGLFNLAPPPGVPSELGANPYGAPIVFIPSIRQADGEYGITLRTLDVSQLVDVESLELTIWGNPWSILHDPQRGNCLNETEPSFGRAKCSIGRPILNVPNAYLTLPTDCAAPMRFTARASSWQGGSAVRTSDAAALEDCGSLPFDPRVMARLTDPRASSPSGYDFDIEVDTLGVLDPTRRAPTPVRKAVVTLPEGVTINPSVGSGLGVCTPEQYAAETPLSPLGAGCPAESKIGEFTVSSPIVSGQFEGALFLAEPHRNPFGSLLAIYLIAKSIDRGILVKVAGELKADPDTGSLTATFDRLPQLPYSKLHLHFREGQRSPLATPGSCGSFFTKADLTPWRNESIVEHAELPLSINSGVDGGPCPHGLAPFNPVAKGGMLNSNAGSYTPFYLHLTRTDAEQEIVSYSAEFPPGLLGKIAGVPYCPEAAIEAAAHRSGVEERDRPSCPAASQIGRTYSGYGVGPVLAYAPGGLYLAGPYHGSSFSVVAIDSALVGPFDLGTVIVRSAVRIDPETTQASIDATGTDPIPHIIDGIPIHLRDVRAYIDRPSFTVNPTSCEPSTISSALNGAGERFADISDDTLAIATAPFQAFNCSALGFKPKVTLALKGGTKRGRHPSLRVVVRPRPGDANIAQAAVTLPSTQYFDQNHIDTICTRPQFARHDCPAGSIYGHVRVFTPLLEQPMEGPAYLRSSGNTLPDLVFALRGQGIEVDVAGRIDSVKGRIRGTFPAIPDAPVTKFVLRMNSGKRGVLVNATRDLCAKAQLANSRFLGHANRGWVSHPQISVHCQKKRRGSHAKHGKGKR
jgi:hypothetical protein